MIRIPRILMRAEIVIDLEAADLVEAGSHQLRLAEHFAVVQQQYPGARLCIRERREKGRKARALAPVMAAAGKLGASR